MATHLHLLLGLVCLGTVIGGKEFQYVYIYIYILYTRILKYMYICMYSNVYIYMCIPKYIILSLCFLIRLHEYTHIYMYIRERERERYLDPEM